MTHMAGPQDTAAAQEPDELGELLQEVGGPVSLACGRWLVVAAHPDDETIGASWILRRSRDAYVLHVTDGAPRDRALWSCSFRGTRRQYAVLRAREAQRALVRVGLLPGRRLCLSLVDQEASWALLEITRRIEQTICLLAPAVVVVHPYEGGHPDHDAVAFAVHAAVARLRARRWAVPFVLEMASYHRAHGRLETGGFLPGPEARAERTLGSNEQAEKEMMLACFASQKSVLADFTCGRERYRRAPAYDFRCAPHSGRLHYESLGRSMTGQWWRALAKTALVALGLTRLPDGRGEIDPVRSGPC